MYPQIATVLSGFLETPDLAYLNLPIKIITISTGLFTKKAATLITAEPI
jgi:hypothetical protein